MPESLDIDLGPAGLRTVGRAPLALTHRVVRPLTPADLTLLAGEKGSTPPPLKRIRDTHHALARALAGGMKPGEVAAAFSYSLSRISILQADPTFQELVAYYRSHVDLAFQDTNERMAALAGDFVAELGARLEEDPDSMSHGFVLDAVKVLADRTGNGPRSTQVNVNVSLATRLQAARERAGLAPKLTSPPVEEGEE